MNTIKQIMCLLCTLLIICTSCSKFEGYYDYENKEKVYAGTTLSYLESKQGTFDSVLTALNRLPTLKEALLNDSLTFFAPTNASFQTALSNLNLVRENQGKSKKYIQTIDLAQLDTLMTKYMVKGLINTDSMQFIDGLFVDTYGIYHPMHAQRVKGDASGLSEGGIELVYYSDTKENSFQSQWVRSASQAVNIYTTNGVIFILSGKHEFGFGDFLTRMNSEL